MNRTSHTDEPYGGEGLNQSPRRFSNDLTSNEDFNGRVNRRCLRASSSGYANQSSDDALSISARDRDRNRNVEVDVEDGAQIQGRQAEAGASHCESQACGEKCNEPAVAPPASEGADDDDDAGDGQDGPPTRTRERMAMYKTKRALVTFGKFVGPGFMIAVAYSKCT
jgi:metal iron transporter